MSIIFMTDNTICQREKIKMEYQHGNISSPLNTDTETTISQKIFSNYFSCGNRRILLQMPVKCVAYGPINYNPVSVEIMAYHRTDGKPLSETVMA